MCSHATTDNSRPILYKPELYLTTPEFLAPEPGDPESTFNHTNECTCSVLTALGQTVHVELLYLNLESDDHCADGNYLAFEYGTISKSKFHIFVNFNNCMEN